MESYLSQNFEVKPKGTSDEVLERWRNLCGVVKNPKRRFRFTANLSKRYEAAAMRRTNQVRPFSLLLWSHYLCLCIILIYECNVPLKFWVIGDMFESPFPFVNLYCQLLLIPTKNV